MIRLLIISDFTESFSHKLLAGIVDYSRRKEQWIVRRMPPSYKAQIGIQGLLRLSKEWDIDAILGQFEPTDDLSTLTNNGIVVVAQDFKQRFTTVPNVTGDYIGTGKMAARFFIDRGFKNFGFFGFNDVCWSDERCEGFRREVEAAGFGSSFYAYRMQEIDMVWYYQRNRLREWLQSIPKPIAIMACDDNQGENLIEACHFCGTCTAFSCNNIKFVCFVFYLFNDDWLKDSILFNRITKLFKQLLIKIGTWLLWVWFKEINITPQTTVCIYFNTGWNICRSSTFCNLNIMKSKSCRNQYFFICPGIIFN